MHALNHNDQSFQLTHSRGVRRQPRFQLCYFSNFNSRTHVECDHLVRADSTALHHFNSRTHVECDKCCLTVALLRQVFQLTHSRGVRLVIFAFAPCRGKHFNSRTHVECDVNTAGIFIPTNDFNSRTHVECDIIHRFDSLVKQISTHALTWSATKSYFVRRLDSQISTHALTWSATMR